MAQAQAISNASMDLLKELQSTDFVLLELTLYLDMHPDDAEAIKQYNELAEQRKSVKDKVEAKFGPLRNYDANPAANAWEWNRSPWPWQL